MTIAHVGGSYVHIDRFFIVGIVERMVFASFVSKILSGTSAYNELIVPALELAVIGSQTDITIMDVCTI